MMRTVLRHLGWLAALTAWFACAGCGEVETPAEGSEQISLLDTYPPLDGSADDIPTDLEAVIAVFSHEVKADTISTSTFYLRRGTDTVQDTIVEVSALDDMKATYLLKPQTPGDWLTSGETYTLVVAGTIVGLTEAKQETDPIGADQTADFQVQ